MFYRFRACVNTIYRPQRVNDEPIRFVPVPETKILGETEIYVDLGSTLNLTCTVSSSPVPTEFIFWYRNETVVNYSAPPGRVTVITEDSAAATTNSYLMIRNARVEDSGIYTCTPSNANVAKVKVHVLKGEKPAAMQTNGVATISAALSLVVMATARWLI
ncbi:Titin [Amphibalanus amphitrite]|uniref:Titin n=1 Tax=Amphibalanus amphitrite TaxID=1232801 RepID=A0A6A4WEA3_AMPAM|nr:Titin [Amphibalanus amphitrite]